MTLVDEPLIVSPSYCPSFTYSEAFSSTGVVCSVVVAASVVASAAFSPDFEVAHPPTIHIDANSAVAINIFLFIINSPFLLLVYPSPALFYFTLISLYSQSFSQNLHIFFYDFGTSVSAKTGIQFLLSWKNGMSGRIVCRNYRCHSFSLDKLIHIFYEFLNIFFFCYVI